MRVVLILGLCVGLGSTTGIAGVVESNGIVTVQGQAFKDAVVVTTDTGIKIRHKFGIVNFSYSELTVDELAQFGVPTNIINSIALGMEDHSLDPAEADSGASNEDAEVIRHAAQKGFYANVLINKRNGFYAIAKVIRMRKETGSQSIDVERLRGPQNLSRHESIDYKRPEYRREELTKPIMILDMGHRLVPGAEGRAFLYPTGRRYWFRDIYVLDPGLIPSFMRREIPPYGAFEKLVWGGVHDTVFPLSLAGIGELAFLPQIQWDFFYWFGVAAGGLVFFGLLYLAFFRVRRRH